MGAPFSGTAKLVDDKLSLDVEAAPEGKPLRVAGSLGSLDRFLAGDDAALELGVNAPRRERYAPTARATAETKGTRGIEEKHEPESVEAVAEGDPRLAARVEEEPGPVGNRRFPDLRPLP